ncbi:hypothetical protein HK104_002937 [Borealophlyctis nickersoniae]|nr:hypothetical protein HK104_002937 [Borealophlyctis nickersoniae]
MGRLENWSDTLEKLVRYVVLTTGRKVGARILVQGLPVEEYQTVVEGSVGTCFVEAREGKRYGVEVENQAYEGSPEDELFAEAVIDGQSEHVGGVFCSTLGQRRLRGDRLQPFVFTLPRPNKDKREGDATTIEAGTVEIHFDRVQRTLSVKRPPVNVGRQASVAEKTKAKELITHTTSFGEPEPSKERHFLSAIRTNQPPGHTPDLFSSFAAAVGYQQLLPILVAGISLSAHNISDMLLASEVIPRDPASSTNAFKIPAAKPKPTTTDDRGSSISPSKSTASSEIAIKESEKPPDASPVQRKRKIDVKTCIDQMLERKARKEGEDASMAGMQKAKDTRRDSATSGRTKDGANDRIFLSDKKETVNPAPEGADATPQSDLSPQLVKVKSNPNDEDKDDDTFFQRIKNTTKAERAAILATLDLLGTFRQSAEETPTPKRLKTEPVPVEKGLVD